MASELNEGDSIMRDEEKEEEIFRLLLEEEINATTRDRPYEEFRKNLAWFHVSTYFAKPSCLSPLHCARFGWVNIHVDTLQCCSCQAFWVVLFPAGISATARTTLTQKYEDQLCEAHADSCWYRPDAAAYLTASKNSLSPSLLLTPTSSKKDSQTSAAAAAKHQADGIPSWLATVLPDRLLDIFDNPSPTQGIRKPWKRMMGSLGRFLEESQTEEWPEWRIPDEIWPTKEEMVFLTDATFENDPNQMSDRLVRSIRDVPGPVTSLERQALVLTILGWESISPESTESDTLKFCAECPLCLATFQGEAVSSSPTPKRRRISNTTTTSRHDPWLAHRHYCPYVVGFPTARNPDAVPLCRWLLFRLLGDESNSHPSEEQLIGPVAIMEAFLEGQRLLKSGLSRQRLPPLVTLPK